MKKTESENSEDFFVRRMVKEDVCKKKSVVNVRQIVSKRLLSLTLGSTLNIAITIV